MNLTHETVLRGVVRALQERVMPAIDDPFATEAARLAQVLLRLMVNGLDDIVAARADENRELRALFADAAPIMSGDLAARLGEAARSQDPGLKISELDREGDRLRRLLVALHAEIETRDDAPAKAMDARIWQLMNAVERRRQPLL